HLHQASAHHVVYAIYITVSEPLGARNRARARDRSSEDVARTGIARPKGSATRGRSHSGRRRPAPRVCLQSDAKPARPSRCLNPGPPGTGNAGLSAPGGRLRRGDQQSLSAPCARWRFGGGGPDGGTLAQAPSFRGHPQASGIMCVQAFLAELAVEGLVERTVRGPSGAGGIEGHAALIGPATRIAGDELGALIAPDCLRVTRTRVSGTALRMPSRPPPSSPIRPCSPPARPDCRSAPTGGHLHGSGR
ncbi:hypothetical protein C8N38_108194, partial [Rhodovulum kholense]